MTSDGVAVGEVDAEAVDRARTAAAEADRVVVKAGTNSLTDEESRLDRVKLDKLVADVDDPETVSGGFPVNDFVEKPAREQAPSNLAITGRYVLTPEIFDVLGETSEGVGGELQLTDAIRKLESVRGVELEGDRYDIGNIPSWLKANLEMALKHDDGEMHDAVEELIAEYR